MSALLLLLLLVGSPGAQAREVLVGPDGEVATLTAALMQAQDGDVLRLQAATFAECVNTGGRSVELVGVEGTVLDGSGCGTVLTIPGGTVGLSGLRITGAGAQGLSIDQATVALEDVLLEGLGREGLWGGAIWAVSSSLTLRDCVFEGNQAERGGAVAVAWYTELTDQGSVYTGNTATAGGGAVYSYAYDTLAWDGASFAQNSAPYGGALLVEWAWGLELRDSVLSGNSASAAGGAVRLYAVDPLATLDGVLLDNNTAGGSGGALQVEWYVELELRDTQLLDNQAGTAGGGLYAYVPDAVTVEGGTWCGNRAQTGGAVALEWAAADRFTNSVFVGNEAAQGGALYRYASGAGVLRNNTFVGNQSSGWGSTLYAAWYAYGSVVNNLFVDSGEGTAVYAADPYDYSNSTLAYNGWYNNLPGHGGGYFDVQEGLDGQVVGDPRLVAWDLGAWEPGAGCAGADLRLGSGSPMRDAGDPAVLDPDGSRSDIGAWGGPDAPVEDQDGDGYTTAEDCDDTNAELHPGAEEKCDNLDNDCDSVVDGEGAVDPLTWMVDWDGDGYGDPATARVGCEAADGEVSRGGDCDDQNPYRSPGVAERCGDGFDQDCDGIDATCDSGDSEPDPPSSRCGCAAGGGESGAWLGPLGLGLVAALRRARRGARWPGPG